MKKDSTAIVRKLRNFILIFPYGLHRGSPPFLRFDWSAVSVTIHFVVIVDWVETMSDITENTRKKETNRFNQQNTFEKSNRWTLKIKTAKTASKQSWLRKWN
jgi:hypothetical protein